MAIEYGTILVDLSIEQYKKGKVGNELLVAVFSALKRIAPSIRNVGDGFTRAVVTNANSTNQVVKTGPGKVYHIRVENGSTSKIVVDVLDGTVVRKRFFCPAGVSATDFRSAEDAGMTDTEGVGTEYDTSINVKAFLASDGTTTAAANVTVFVDYK